MRNKPSILFFLCGIALAVGYGCSDSGTNPVRQSTLVEQGWTAFETGDFAGAKSRFYQAIGEDAADGAAHNGLGWTNMQLGSLQASVGNFDAALSTGFAGAAPHAGKAIVLRDLEPVDYEAAIAAADSALAVDPGFTFDHDAGVDWKDLRLILAQSYFALGRYPDANAQVGALDGTMQNVSSPTFVEDLLAEIERLGTIVGS